MGNSFVRVTDPKLVHVVMDDRDEFDRIGIQPSHHLGNMLVKAIDYEGLIIIFQYPIEN